MLRWRGELGVDGDFGCNKAISVDGDVLCVVNEELEGLKGDVDVGWSVLV